MSSVTPTLHDAEGLNDSNDCLSVLLRPRNGVTLRFVELIYHR